MKYVAPSTRESAFNCPHCGALAAQEWLGAFAYEISAGKLPNIIGEEELRGLNGIQDQQVREILESEWGRLATAGLFIDGWADHRCRNVQNLWFSKCFNCEGIAVWLRETMLYPAKGDAPPANPDMSADIRRDYLEASTILNHSPRGAAALIRLAIQKLCAELGEPGKNINDDIATLVRKGLDPRVQKALDAVRVIGNSAVHPGQIDLKDDRATAETLFKLLNLIVDKTVSEPKHVAEVYASLPEGALKAIERRDAQK